MRRELKNRTVNWHLAVVVVHDIAAVSLAWLLAFALRFSSFDIGPQVAPFGPVLIAAIVVQSLVLMASGLYRTVWRYVGVGDVQRLLVAIAIGALLVPLVQVLVAPGQTVPRTTLVLQPILAAFLMGGSRLAYRIWHDYYDSRSTSRHGEPVVVLGAGFSGVQLLEQLARSAQWHAVALLDDDRRKLGRVISGVKVVGTTADIARVCARYGAGTVIIAMPSAPVEVRRRLFDECRSVGLEVLTVPSFDEMLSEGRRVENVRPVQIGDLLGRDAVTLDESGISALLRGRVVLVSGAGGSIGSELCRQILRFNPARLVLFEQSEFLLYQLLEEFSLRDDFGVVLPVIGDVRDPVRVASTLSQYRPAILFHAAAYKHVPLMEDINAWEAVRNNAYGTLVLGSAAVEHGVDTFVMVSTDKAVNPTNVMGATKRAAEIVCAGLQRRGRTRFEIVRFGNVLGSAGSVIPKFQEQIRRGGPVTVTHPEMIRYFMSIPEAAQLVLQAAAMGKGGEIFVLDMGKPVRITDLARDLIRLSGFTEQQIPIQFTGLRPGEKLYEELLADGETTVSTPHPKLRIARARDVDDDAFADLQSWLRAREPLTDDEVRRDLHRWVPEYAPSRGPELRLVNSRG
jgi:FlaA1/EpsC-like NDP-sugar epimerase